MSQNPTSRDTPDEQVTNDVLEVEDLTKVYPDGTVAVDDIGFAVSPGDFCVIIGPSGCGKSTTLHSLIGTVEPTDGTVRLSGNDITHAPTYERDIGLVFQDFQLFPHRTVRENVAYGLERIETDEDEAEERIDNALDLMDIRSLADRDPTELSAGQKQRVALARSIVLEPELLLLDEPLGDLDYKLQKKMERELLRIHRELDITFIYVTHDQTQAMRLADQLVVMNDGKIEQSASVNDVYNNPATGFVATFVGDSNTFFGTVTEILDGGERARVETAFGSLTASTANLYSDPHEVVGQRMALSVRPHYVTLDADAENTLDCSVESVIHQQGSGTQLVLNAAADGQTAEFQLKSHDILDFDADTATVGWSAEHTTLLERNSVVDGVDLEEDILGE